jgi:alkylated DNA nucleotide flippase Atl1
MDRERYVESVLAVVEAIPPGRVMSYGAVAGAVGVGGPRQVGRVLAMYGGPVPWWRVVHADGTLAPCHDGSARRRHADEGTPRSSPTRVDMRRAAWRPEQHEPADPHDPPAHQHRR